MVRELSTRLKPNSLGNVCTSPGSIELQDFSSWLLPYPLLHSNIISPFSFPPEIEIPQGLEHLKLLYAHQRMSYPVENKAHLNLPPLSFQMSLDEGEDLAEECSRFWQKHPKASDPLIYNTSRGSVQSLSPCASVRMWVRVEVWVWVRGYTFV